MQCPRRPEQGIKSSGVGFTDGCEPLCVCWDLISGPLEEQSVMPLVPGLYPLNSCSPVGHILIPHPLHTEETAQQDKTLLRLTHTMPLCNMNCYYFIKGQCQFTYPALVSQSSRVKTGRVGCRNGSAFRAVAALVVFKSGCSAFQSSVPGDRTASSGLRNHASVYARTRVPTPTHTLRNKFWSECKRLWAPLTTRVVGSCPLLWMA